jgi:uncharacterized DUF497 family protein
MIFEWDEAKRAANLAKHGIDFDAVRLFDWSAAVHNLDTRKDGRRTAMAGFRPDRRPPSSIGLYRTRRTYSDHQHSQGECRGADSL